MGLIKFYFYEFLYFIGEYGKHFEKRIEFVRRKVIYKKYLKKRAICRSKIKQIALC